MNNAPGPPERGFSLNDGGPFRRLVERLHLVSSQGMVRGDLLALLAWVPLALEAAVRFILGIPLDVVHTDLSAHARLLVALPTMFYAERLVEAACRSTISTLYSGDFLDAARLDAIVRRAEKWRDARWPEVLLLIIALVGGQLALWQVTGATGLAHGTGTISTWSFSRVWYGLVALPLSQFVLYRWLWRWVIWTTVLVRLARPPLRALATHPDMAAGLACLGRPLSGFAVFSFAVGATLAGAWGTNILMGRSTVEGQLPVLVGFICLMLALAVGPLLPFSFHIFYGRRQTLAQYGDFANDYVRSFHRKWILSGAGGEKALGAPDIQSLADLGGAFSVASSTRLFVFGMRQLIAIAAGCLAPMFPILLSTLPTKKVIERIFSVLLGGLPL